MLEGKIGTTFEHISLKITNLVALISSYVAIAAKSIANANYKHLIDDTLNLKSCTIAKFDICRSSIPLKPYIKGYYCAQLFLGQ